MSERYALLDLPDGPDDGEARWWLYLQTSGGTPYLNDREMTPGAVAGWWSSPVGGLAEQPDTWTVEVEKPGGTVTTHYVRTLETSDDAYPEQLTVEQYVSRRDEDDVAYDPRVQALYTAIREDQPPVREPVEGPWLRLDGEPPPDDGLTWMANLPYTLRERREYGHLFPGKLLGFIDALREALNAIGDGVDAYTSAGKIDVYIKVWLPKRPPVQDEAKPILSGLSRTEKRRRAAQLSSTEERITRHLAFHAIDHVGGLNRAEAKQHWDDLLNARVGYVQALVSSPCPTCGGHGFIEPALDNN